MPHVGKSARVVVFVVLAAAVVVFAIPMGRAPVWEPNNARWILLARDMVERGHWLMPEIRGVPNEGLYKPQLFAWTIALASLPSHRVTEFTAAVPPSYRRSLGSRPSLRSAGGSGACRLECSPGSF